MHAPLLLVAAALAASPLSAPGLATPPAPAAAARLPDPARLAAFHELLAGEPHVAGTPGDARLIERLAAELRAIGEGVEGWTVEVQEFFPYLARPVSAKLGIVAVELGEGGVAPGDAGSPAPTRRGVLPLRVVEPNLAIDPATAHPDLDIAWNAYAGSGTVEAGVVYVNYGRREDFERLAALGVDPRGKIAIARYGGNFRGYKAKFAEQAGCVGLVIYTDPADSGSARGRTWPEGGGWANPECVQRGSLGTLPWTGDPLTPGRFASEDAERLDPAEVALPKIPVQPIGYGAASEILRRMKGTPAPAEWRGALPCDYALADDALRLRLEVEQTREVVRTANVIARLRGTARPDEEVVVGSHHDAWCFGAADPAAGTICTLESARDFAALAREGARPARTLAFAFWGAEEYGIIGSSEFVESGGAGPRTIAYLNLDMAAMGLRPGGSVSPTLRPLVARALAAAPGPRGEGTALDAWSRGADGTPAFGDLGGGSDHVGFWCHAGVPSMSLSTGGSEGTSYHSNYDTVAWYRAVVGDDYAAARLLTGIVNAIVAELARGDIGHASPLALVDDCARQARALRDRSDALGFASDDAVRRDLATLVERFEAIRPLAAAIEPRLGELPRPAVDAALAAMRAAWLSPDGLEGRPWFRNLYAATDRDSGYGTAPWPLARENLEDIARGVPGARERWSRTQSAYLGAWAGVLGALSELSGGLEPSED